MKERPLLVVVIGYIIGILWGLYINLSIVLLYIFIATIYIILKNERYFRYLKIIFNRKSIFLIIIVSLISNFIVVFQKDKYDNFYNDGEQMNLVATVVGNKEEKEYKDTYKIRIDSINELYETTENAKNNKNLKSKDYKNHCLILSVKKKDKTNLKYGDKIKVKGEFIKPMTARNYGGFDYSTYLKSIKVYGTLKAENIEILSKKNCNPIMVLSNNVNVKIHENVNEMMPEKYASIFTGLILGDTTKIEKEVKENFKIANISHILAISGMHITYIIIGIEMLLKPLLGKRKMRIVTVIILIFYMFITGFSPSVVRASIMGILMIISKLIYRKNDIWTSISVSLLILLIYNPFLITNVGLQLSYLGTIGIICFNKNVYKFLRNIKIKNKKIKYRINRKIVLLVDKIKEILSVTLSAQIVILPIILFHFNSLGIYFFISNILVSVIIGPIIIGGFICIMISFFSMQIAKLISIFIVVGIKMLVVISEISHLPFSQIYIVTPKVWQILIYYILIVILNKIYTSFTLKEPSFTDIRIKNLVALTKYRLNQNKKKYFKIIISFIVIIFIFNIIPKKLKIYFVDVGQGDCTFIVTPKNKTILIDGGGSLSTEFDVGESTLLPYILDRGYTKIDYIFISHFDQDHVGGIFKILEKLKVGQVFISQQGENSENYQKFLKIVENKDLNVKVLKQGDSLKIENNLFFDILWPVEEQIQENILNNNAMVMKLRYKDFSMLFTGDIEKIAEEKILEFYKNSNILKSDILKIAHHGSKSSSTQEFLEKVNPKFCLIGVGENNLFGHPSNEVSERLETKNVQIYRTDKDGEIIFEIVFGNGGKKQIIKTKLK